MTRPTDSEIAAACDKHGAKAVYDAAYRRMAGDRTALPKLGLQDVDNAFDADQVGSTAFRLMEPDERATDLADTTIGLAKLTARGVLPPPSKE